mmetsp:Transcript_46303/g.122044  ORF Transcript_46303/g.122044 Transcript_46303/m.122044 type:complete len:226 (-) Transcript_46303:370-1047(-)
MSKSSMPAKTTMSPACACSTAMRPVVLKTNTSDSLTRRTGRPGPADSPISRFGSSVPFIMRPTPSRPMYASEPTLEICSCSGACIAATGFGSSRMASRSGVMPGPMSSSTAGAETSTAATRLSADVYTTWKSVCSSEAPSSQKRSNVRSMTASGCAAGLSTLFTTTSTLWPIASAFLSTKRVCGFGPSCASTTSSTPSTMLRTRSTSPPKSAWPGVSTMLTWVPS